MLIVMDLKRFSPFGYFDFLLRLMPIVVDLKHAYFMDSCTFMNRSMSSRSEFESATIALPRRDRSVVFRNGFEIS